MTDLRYLTFLFTIIVCLWLSTGFMRFSKKTRSSETSTRGLSLASLYAVMFVIFWLPPAATLFFSSFAIVMSVIEVYGTARHFNQNAVRKDAYFFSLAYLPLYPIVPVYFPGFAALFFLVYLVVIVAILVLTQDIIHPTGKISTALILVLLSYVFSQFAWLRHQENGSFWCLFLFYLIVFSDVYAYVCGNLWGKRKFIPRVSPGKTIEGALGSFVNTLFTAVLFNYVLKLQMSVIEVLGAAGLLNIAAQLGDLCLSLVKREAGIKDFGKLLPGHGGFLDRFDSFVLVLPMFSYFIIIGI